ncbi:hypothetical protein [Methylopila sp. M107]|uniref:hypothetical protein n=1 Tax=Methylopila sp. M107 TaxID=1101190 RepID=UPI00039DFB17|nr:hypothetical protein [Methylopila sp. M107]
MAGRKQRLIAMLGGVETTYNVPPALTGAQNAIVAFDYQLTPLAGEEVQDDELLPWFGHQGEALVGDYVQIEYSIRLAGSGTAGTPPAYGPILRSAGLAEVITAGQKVEYSPISQGFESLSLWMNQDGALHKLSGGFSNIVFNWDVKKRPFMRVTTRGLYVPVTAQALPTVDRSKFKKALIASKTNTPTLALHATPIVAQSVSIDLGVQFDKIDWVNDEEFDISDRKISGTVVSKAAQLGTKDWFATAKAETLGLFALTHGVVAGNIIEIGGASVQVGRPTQGDNSGILTYSLPTKFTAQTAGGDFLLTVR